MATPTDHSYQAVVLDIEGTTTPISFVYDVLFPFVRTHLCSFLEQNWERAEVQDDVALIREQALSDVRDAPEAPAVASSEAAPDEIRETVIANVLWQMDRDRKTTGLKSLQGRIWKQGYAQGDLKAIVYDDVPIALRAWNDAGIPVYIYSSGSIAAQKLLFGHTRHGDLTPCLKGYFDTTTGPKKEASSYEEILNQISQPAGAVVFATDNLDEARAARVAGMQAVILDRPGNPALPAHDFPVLTSLAPLVLGHSEGD